MNRKIVTIAFIFFILVNNFYAFGKNNNDKDLIQITEYKGQELGIKIPKWIKYAQNNNLKKIKQYFNCTDSKLWIISSSSSNKEFLLEWSSSISSIVLISTQIRNDISEFIAKDIQLSTEEKETVLLEVDNQLSFFEFSGIEFVENFWFTSIKGNSKDLETTYYAVYKIDKAKYERQIHILTSENLLSEYFANFLLNNY